jgi:hypothetical protein
MEGGQVVDATAFATAPERRRSDGPVSAAFVEALVRGAEEVELPVEWIEALRALAR